MHRPTDMQSLQPLRRLCSSNTPRRSSGTHQPAHPVKQGQHEAEHCGVAVRGGLHHQQLQHRCILQCTVLQVPVEGALKLVQLQEGET